MNGENGRLRILIVEPAGLLWGSERALLDLLSHIDPSRYDVTVACPGGSPFLKEVRRLNIGVVEVPMQLLHLRGRIARLRALVSLCLATLRIRPHIVHVNQAGVLRLAKLASLLVGARVVCHVRLFEDARSLRARASSKLRPDRLIAVSKAILRELSRDDAIEWSQIECVYDPLDGVAFRQLADGSSALGTRSSIGIPEAAFVVSLVGRVCREKRQGLLINAALLGRKDVFYLIIGGDPPSVPGQRVYREELQMRVHDSWLASRVIFTGMRNDVAALMLASDLVVLTSDEEPLGRVLLEALSLNRPIVAPAGGGALEIVGDDERGLSFEPGNATGLADCISAIMADPLAARARTDRGAEWARTVCAPERHAREIERIYDQAVASEVAR